MNYKSLIVIALVFMAVLAAPVAAEGMWNGDNWVDIHHNDKCTKVVFNPQTGNTNCYNENVGSKADIANDPNTYSGRVDVIVKTHTNALNPVMYLANNLTPEITKTIEVNNDGLNTIPNLAPGRFKLTLDRFDLPDEVAYFDIAAGQQEPTRVVFEGQGYAVSSVPAKCSISINSASYGMIKQVCEQVLITPAYTEYRVRGHWEYHWYHWDWDHSNSWSQWSSEVPFRYDQIPSQDKQSQNIPAHYHTVCHNEGSFADVTQQVKRVVASGHNTFVFSNGWAGNYFGGIYDSEQSKSLLAEIEDPAEGQVKDVTISYIACDGTEKNLKMQEYQQITL